MPAYSGGNRWVGVVSGAEPPTPPALAALRSEPDSKAVQIGRDLWMEIAYLRRTWTRHASKLRQRLADQSRADVSDGLDREKLRLLERALLLLDGAHPRLPADIVNVLLPWAAPTRPLPSSPDSVGPELVLELGPGRRYGPDDVRQMLRALGREYYLAGHLVEADRCRLLVNDLRRGRPVTLDAATLGALERASRWTCSARTPRP